MVWGLVCSKAAFVIGETISPTWWLRHPVNSQHLAYLCQKGVPPSRTDSVKTASRQWMGPRLPFLPPRPCVPAKLFAAPALSVHEIQKPINLNGLITWAQVLTTQRETE